MATRQNYSTRGHQNLLLTGVKDPVSATDAATKAYVDSKTAGTGAALTTATPAAEPAGAAGAVGTATTAARADHVHATPAFGTVTPTAYADVASNGSAATLARSDHNHGLPYLPTYKDTARVATTANIALTGLQVIDGVTVGVGDRVLVKNQTTPSLNGLYNAALAGWSRTQGANSTTTDAELRTGAIVPVAEGTLGTNTVWMLSTNGSITIGTTALNFVQIGSQMATTVPVAESYGTAGAVGTSTLSARADHVHPMPAASATDNTKLPLTGGTTTGLITASGGITVPDNTFTITDNITPTKKAVFEAANISANTTRTYTFPDNNGTLALQSDDLYNKITTCINANYNVLLTDEIVFIGTTGTTVLYVTLPTAAAAGVGRKFRIKNMNGALTYPNRVTHQITVSGGGTIDGDTSIDLYYFFSYEIISDGSRWWLV